MIWIICFIISLLLLGGTILSVLHRMRSTKIIHSFFSPYRIAFGGLYITIIAALMPVYLMMLQVEKASVFKALMLTIYNTFQVFTINVDGGSMINDIRCADNPIPDIYNFYVLILFLAAPIMTFSFLATLFKNVIPGIRYWFVRKRNTYAFSELNEKSLTLAKDLRRNHPRAALVFAKVDREAVSEVLVSDAEALKAICFQCSLEKVNFCTRKNNKALIFFVMDEQNDEQVSMTKALVENFGDVEGSELYLFSENKVSELMLPGLASKKMIVRRINEKNLLVNDILYRYGHDYFRKAYSSGDNNDKIIHPVFVGFGENSRELLKALTWYTQMIGYSVVMDVFDEDENAEDHFRSMCPELMDQNHNGVQIPGEAQYLIRFHSGMDLEGFDFIKNLMKMHDITYCFVDTGDDEKSIRKAIDLRMIFERMAIHPVIHVLVRNSDYREIIDNAVNFRDVSYGLLGVGDRESLYAEKNVINNELQQEALAAHLAWGEENEFWQFEYHFNSSMASALHQRARIACHLPGVDEKPENVTPQEMKAIENLEHRRWNAYMRANGYVFSGSRDKITRNDMGKMHHDLVPYEDLSEEEKKKDSKVVFAQNV